MSAFPKYNSQLSHLTISPVTTICHLDDWNCLSRMISSPSPSSLLIFLFCPFFYFSFMFLTFLPQGVFPCYSLCYSLECRFLPILSCPAASCLSHHCSDSNITYLEGAVLALASEAEFLSTPITSIELIQSYFIVMVTLLSASPSVTPSSFVCLVP